MKNLQNNFTTPEQSKRLLELGVPADSADGYYTNFDDGTHAKYPNYICYRDITWWNDGDSTPSWSVGRLNEIFVICSDIHTEIYDFDLEGTQMERAMQAFENYAKYNWLDFSELKD